MSKDHEQLYAYFATLAAILYLVTVAAVLAFNGRYSEAIGVSAAVTGLIGVMQPPRPRTTTIDNPPSNPVPVDPAP